MRMHKNIARECERDRGRVAEGMRDRGRNVKERQRGIAGKRQS